jgi:membrane protein
LSRTETIRVGRAPASPEQLPRRDWIAAARRAIAEFLADDCMGLAQQIAFSSLLAFFPAVILLVGLFGLVGVFDELKEFLGVIAPGAVIEAIGLAEQSAAERGSSAAAVVLGGAGALWVASGAMATTIKAVNRAHNRVETRPGWRVRLLGIGLVLLTGVVTAILFLFIVFGGPLGAAIAVRVGAGGAFELVWGIVRWPLAFAVILLFLAIVYWAAPDVHPRNWRWLTPGSLVGGILWLGLSGLFALYTALADTYDKTYGSLAGGIVLLLWLYYSAVALLFGAELNAELDRQASIRAAGGERAGLVEPGRRV